MQAQWLRYFYTILDHGFWTLAVEIAKACFIVAGFSGFRGLMENPVERWLVATSFRVTLWVSVAISLILGICGFPIPVTAVTAQDKFWLCIINPGILIFGAWYSLIAPICATLLSPFLWLLEIPCDPKVLHEAGIDIAPEGI